MKRKIWCMAVVAVVLWGQAAWAQDMYVIAVGGVGTRITSVPYTISAAGLYYLGSNLTHTGTTDAITVIVDDVTLDLMGFNLSHTGAVTTQRGIFMNGRANVEIRNGTIRGFNHGIEEQGAGNKHRIINIRATNNGNSGIVLAGSNHLVKGCNCSNNSQFGIYLGNSSGNIASCIASNNTSYGIYLASGIIENSVAISNSIGIFLTGPGSVLNNAALGNTIQNFHLGSGVATNILVDRNSASGLATNYLMPAGTTGVVITGNNSGTP